MPFPFNWRLEMHPILVHFPIALLSVALLFDVIGWARNSSSLRLAGLYCLLAGAGGTVLAVLSGRMTPDARERGATLLPRLHLPDVAHYFAGRRVEVHEHWAFILLALVLLWVVVRLAVALGGLRRSGLAMTAGVLTFAVLLVTGYSGGQIVYRQRGRERERGQMLLVNTQSKARASHRSGQADAGETGTRGGRAGVPGGDDGAR